jgi:hypothetical protein
MTVAMVLDSSAAVAYSKGSVNVGEPVAYLADEPGRTFALPVVSIATAACLTDDLDVLMLLGLHPLGEVTAMPAGGWRQLAILSQLLGGVDFAATFLAAEEHDAYILTAEPDRYPDSGRIIDISD